MAQEKGQEKMEWPKRQLSKKGTKPQTAGKRLFKKGEVTEDKEQKRLGNDRMLRLEGILEIISSKCHMLPTSLLQTDLLDYYLPVTLTPTSIPLFMLFLSLHQKATAKEQES